MNEGVALGFTSGPPDETLATPGSPPSQFPATTPSWQVPIALVVFGSLPVIFSEVSDGDGGTLQVAIQAPARVDCPLPF